MKALNENQKFVIIVFIIILVPVLFMMWGNYDHMVNEPFIKYGINYQIHKREFVVGVIGLYNLLAEVLFVWASMLCSILYLLRRSDADRTD